MRLFLNKIKYYYIIRELKQFSLINNNIMKNLDVNLVRELNKNVINQLYNDFENGNISYFTDDENFHHFLKVSLLNEMFVFKNICKYSVVNEINYTNYIYEYPVDDIGLKITYFLSIFYNYYEENRIF
jgi:hypothetical protein